MTSRQDPDTGSPAPEPETPESSPDVPGADEATLPLSSGGKGTPNGEGTTGGGSGGDPGAEARPRRGRIGPYRILRVLGEGGMGVVYLAQQVEPIRRQVALKVLRSPVSDEVGIHRFEVERHTLARMSHPYIAQVFEAGETRDGEPYVVMEYVSGEPVTDYCDRRCLDLDARLDLFQKICEGVHHAHQKGVLHRDLKPANLLVTEVDGRPVPKIIDFGIALGLDRSGLVAPRASSPAVLGTPAYLPPEVVLEAAGGEVDIRSDVFSLGVVLFDLLAGERPFAREITDYPELRRRVEAEEATAPSERLAGLGAGERERRASRRGLGSGRALVRAVRGDLDWITLRATGRRRELRYGSAAELAADVRRHREKRPVRAGPSGPLYRGRKLLRRHWRSFGAGLLLLLTLVAGVVARTQEARRANREAAAAQQVSRFLVELFQVSDPTVTPGETVTARELLDRGAERIHRELAGQPVLRARLMVTMGTVYRQLGLYQEAEALLEEALTLLREHAGGAAGQVGDALLALGVLHWEQGHYERSEGLLDEALELRRRRLGPEHPEVAEVLGYLGSLEKSRGRFPEAERYHLEALSIRSRQGNPVALAEALDSVGTVYGDWGHFELAEEYGRRALEIRREHFGPGHPEVAQTLNGLAIAVAQQGRDEEAEELFRHSLEIREETLGPGHPQVAQSLNNLANVYSALGREQEAGESLRRAAEIWEAQLGPDNPRVAGALNNLGEHHLKRGDLERAEALFQRSLGAFGSTLSPDHPTLAFPLKGLAEVRWEQGRREEAARLFRQALELREGVLDDDHPALMETRERYAELLRALGREAEAAAVEAGAATGPAAGEAPDEAPRDPSPRPPG